MFAANSFYAEPVSCVPRSLFPWQSLTLFDHHQQVVVECSEDSLKTYVNTLSDSGGTISRSFCSNCGSNLFTRTSNFQGVVVVSSGTLDLPLGNQGVIEWTPEQEFFCKRRGAWMAGAGAPAEQQYQDMT